MEYKKLYLILQTFNKEDISDFKRFINSPFYNQNENVQKLFSVISAYHPDYSSRNLTAEKFHNIISPGTPVNNGSINNLITKIINLAEKYLVVKAFEKNETISNRLLLQEYDKRKLDTRFASALTKIKQDLKKQKILDETYYENMYHLSEIEMSFNKRRKPLGKLKAEFDRGLITMQYLLYSFFLRLLHDQIRLFDSELTVKLDENNLWVKKTAANILQYSHTLPYNLLMDIYQRTLKYAEFKEDYDIDESINLIFDNKDFLPADKLKFILSPVYNHCKDKEFAGDKSYGLKSLKIIKLMVEKNLMLDVNGTISDHEYVNFSSAAVKEKDYEWADDFTEKFRKHVSEDRREDSYNYNKAVINYIRGCDENKKVYFEAALKYLTKVNAPDFYYKTRIFLLSLNIFYELRETDTLISLVDSFKHYLSAHKKEIPPALEERYLNFANFLIRLVNLSEKPQLLNAIKLKNSIMEKERVEFKKRLIGKTDEIISSLQSQVS
ncbi:MAG: hypothetical protein IAE90_11265 [Ignavibacteria bacterium]|nr:hypothetical protein [Ignavibacteria bacterium]